MGLYPNYKPRGINPNWDHCSMDRESAGMALARKGVPADYGNPIDAVAWFADADDGELRVMVADYANGRRVTYRRTTRGSSLIYTTRQILVVPTSEEAGA